MQREYPDFGNCLYFIATNHTTPSQHAVLYELGNDLINWLVYIASERPVCGGVATAPMPADMWARFCAEAAEIYGDELAGVVRSTPASAVFLNDIFDRDPLHTLVSGRVVLLGDSAHPITPHAGKVGSAAPTHNY
jgi:2-polyprenyl-6-methoxyphenol hydroxylase-like FAD-dependent oxidoreductase